MLRTLFVAAIAIAARPSIADACHNGVEWTTNDYVRVVISAERSIEKGDFGKAQRALRGMGFPTVALRERAADVKAVLALRLPDKKTDLAKVTERLKKRSESDAGKKDVRYRAWLAEAYAKTGKTDDAREILLDLQKRDLMPDAYAYFTLAKLSKGADRLAAWKACRTKAKDKDICDLPATRS